MEQAAQKHIITALRPFSFIEPATETQRLPHEHKFMPNKDDKGRFVPTDFEVPEFIARHEWISRHNADGAVEDPTVRTQRLAIQAAADAKRQEIINQENANAAEALRRAQGNATRTIAENDAVSADLNRPIGELGVKQGTGIVAPGGITDPKAFEDEINTPVSELRKRSNARAKKTA